MRILLVSREVGLGWGPAGEPVAARPDGVSLPPPDPQEILGALMAHRDALLDELAEVQRWWLAVRKQGEAQRRVVLAPADALPRIGPNGRPGR